MISSLELNDANDSLGNGDLVLKRFIRHFGSLDTEQQIIKNRKIIVTVLLLLLYMIMKDTFNIAEGIENE